MTIETSLFEDSFSAAAAAALIISDYAAFEVQSSTFLNNTSLFDEYIADIVVKGSQN